MDRRGFFSLIGLGALYYKSHNEWGIDNRYPRRFPLKTFYNGGTVIVKDQKELDKLIQKKWTT